MLDDAYCFAYVCSFFLGGLRKKDLNCKEEKIAFVQEDDDG